MRNGFSLIELLIVVTLSVMLLLAATTLFMTLLIGNTRTSSAQVLKAEGNTALGQVEFLLRNAIEIPVCNGSTNTLDIQSIDGGQTTLAAVVDTDGKRKLASQSGSVTRFLTSGSVELEDSNLVFNCLTGIDGASKYVTVSITLQKGIVGTDDARDILSETFTTSINLRSN